MMGINLDSAIQRAGGLHGNRQDGSAVEPAEEVAQSEEVCVTEPVGLGEEQKSDVDADQAVEQESQEPTAVSPAVSQPAKPKRAVKRGASDVLQIPAFPKSLMAMIRSDIPEAQNNSDALAAWVYVKSGRRADVSPEVKELAKKYKGPADEDMLGALLEKVTRIERMSFMSATNSTDLYYMLEWLMLERMAAINSPRIDTVDFTQPAFDQLRGMLRVKIQQAKNAQQVRDGRPIR